MDPSAPSTSLRRLLLEFGLRHVSRVAPVVRASSLPWLARRAYRLDVASTACIMLALATIDAGVIAVFAKQSFAGSVPTARLNLLVGLLGAMSELANVLSFFWTSSAQGRPKVRIISLQQVVMVGAIAGIALVPTGAGSAGVGTAGLLMLLGLVLVARVCWAGIVTLRPTVWRANYPPSVRTSVVSVLSGVQVLFVGVVGASLAWCLDENPGAYRVFLPVACTVALVGVAIYSRTRVRHEARTLREESREDAPSLLQPWKGPLVVLEVLRTDRRYAQFMLCMFILGFSNLTVMPTLVISLREEHHLGYFQSVLITSSVPCFMTLIAIPFWRRILDRSHVVKFRSVHSWVFVVAGLLYTAAAFFDVVWLSFVGAVVMGIGYGGGSLAWNLGHMDFAPPTQTSRYMATHVTLNGVRGLLAPLAVTSAYELLKHRGLDAHLWVQASSCAVGVLGAAGFVLLRWSMGRSVEHAKVSR